MVTDFISSLNLGVVLLAGLVFWLIGALWFSLLFGGVWGRELEKQGLAIQEPNQRQLLIKLVVNYFYNVIIALAVAYVVYLAHSHTLSSALLYGCGVGVSFIACPFLMMSMWENRSLCLTLIDAGHLMVGILVCFFIFAFWG